MPRNDEFKVYVILVREDSLVLAVWAPDEHSATLTAAAHAWAAREREQDLEER